MLVMALQAALAALILATGCGVAALLLWLWSVRRWKVPVDRASFIRNPDNSRRIVLLGLALVFAWLGILLLGVCAIAVTGRSAQTGILPWIEQTHRDLHDIADALKNAPLPTTFVPELRGDDSQALTAIADVLRSRLPGPEEREQLTQILAQRPAPRRSWLYPSLLAVAVVAAIALALWIVIAGDIPVRWRIAIALIGALSPIVVHLVETGPRYLRVCLAFCRSRPEVTTITTQPSSPPTTADQPSSTSTTFAFPHGVTTTTTASAKVLGWKEAVVVEELPPHPSGSAKPGPGDEAKAEEQWKRTACAIDEALTRNRATVAIVVGRHDVQSFKGPGSNEQLARSRTHWAAEALRQCHASSAAQIPLEVVETPASYRHHTRTCDCFAADRRTFVLGLVLDEGAAPAQ